MTTNPSSTKKHKLLVFIAQIILFVLCLWYINYIYRTDISPDKNVTNTFQTVDCKVTEKKLSEKGSTFKQYRADFQVSYSLDDKSYSKWVSGNGLDVTYNSNRKSQETLLNQFELGKTYPCWYNPQNPEEIVLTLRHYWGSAFQLFIPSIVLVTLFYLILRQIGEFLGIIRTRKSSK